MVVNQWLGVIQMLGIVVLITVFLLKAPTVLSLILEKIGNTPSEVDTSNNPSYENQQYINKHKQETSELGYKKAYKWQNRR